MAGKTEPLFSRPVPKSPLFEALKDDERDALIKEMEVESHDEGSVIISEGDPGSSMYLIVSGEVKVYTRGTSGTVYLARLGEGDFFGEVSVLTGKPRTATITASQRTELLRLDKEKLDGVLRDSPDGRGIEWPHNPLGLDTLGHGENAIVRNQRLGMMSGEVVERRPLLTTQLEKVGRAFGGTQDHARARALEQGVRGDGGAVGDVLDFLGVGT